MLLREVGVTEIEKKPLLISGLVLIKLTKDPIAVVRDLRAILKDDPWRLKVVYKIKPLEILVDTRLDLLGEAVDEFVSRIQPDESFKIELRRRFHNIKSEVLIAELAQRFENPVDLENPKKILLVEVLGSNTGIAVCLPTDIISLQSLRNGSKI
ncbi:unnamed protein product [marine sediment metagenome]|uniref:THUMP domain-containing protein n=1 Tax=marine sediment metagenome TaxID=412755 RepID=X0U9Y0_9ZZZZ